MIESVLAVADEAWTIEITLTNRDSMGYRMLLGRPAIAGRIVVDPEASFLLGEMTPQMLNGFFYNAHVSRLTGSKISLLASDPSLYSNKRIMEAGQERRHEMEFLNIKDSYIKLDGCNPEMHYRGGRILNDFDANIPRIRPSALRPVCRGAKEPSTKTSPAA